MKDVQTYSLFLDTEFTGLHQNTTLISLAIVDEVGRSFYAESTEYSLKQLNPWLQDNVVANMRAPKLNTEDRETIFSINEKTDETYVRGQLDFIKEKLAIWLEPYPRIEIWSDCLAYDWVLFCELFGGAMCIPSLIYYIPFDLATLFKVKGIDPDIKREEYAGDSFCMDWIKHNALYDAWLIRACYQKTLQT